MIETRHYHGRKFHDHSGGEAAHDHARPWKWIALGIVLAVLVLMAVTHVISAMETHDSPPAACQLLGGSWNLWNGWRCN